MPAPGVGEYLLNLVGVTYTGLPGVWEHNPHSGAINSSVWSIRWEVGCYVLMGGLAVLGLMKRKRAMLVVLATVIAIPPVLYVGAHALLALLHSTAQPDQMAGPRGPFFRQPVEVTLENYHGFARVTYAMLAGWYFRVVPYFAAGAVAYFLRDRIPYSPVAAWVAAAAAVLLSFALPLEWYNPVSYFLMCIPLTYLIVTVGVSALRSPPPFRGGDYSYGIYLYAFPAQQMVVVSGLDLGMWQLNTLITLPLVLVLAMLSWHFLEQPLLARRSEVAERFAARRRPRSLEPDDGIALAR